MPATVSSASVTQMKPVMRPTRPNSRIVETRSFMLTDIS
jgi:hypothetical protein